MCSDDRVDQAKKLILTKYNKQFNSCEEPRDQYIFLQTWDSCKQLMRISLRKKKTKNQYRCVLVKYSAQTLSILFIRNTVEILARSATLKQQPNLQGHQPPAAGGTLNPASIMWHIIGNGTHLKSYLSSCKSTLKSKRFIWYYSSLDTGLTS